jgi:hypothetical protein
MIGFSGIRLSYITTNQISGFSTSQITALNANIQGFTTQVLSLMTKEQANAITASAYNILPSDSKTIITTIRNS